MNRNALLPDGTVQGNPMSYPVKELRLGKQWLYHLLVFQETAGRSKGFLGDGAVLFLLSLTPFAIAQ